MHKEDLGCIQAAAPQVGRVRVVFQGKLATCRALLLLQRPAEHKACMLSRCAAWHSSPREDRPPAPAPVPPTATPQLKKRWQCPPIASVRSTRQSFLAASGFL